MQLRQEIEKTKSSLAAAKPRSERRAIIQRDLVMLMVKQLKREVRRDKRK